MLFSRQRPPGKETLTVDNRKPLKMLYTNWKGETEIRTVKPIQVYYGSTEWHEEQWIMEVYDLDKEARRHFAMKDIKAIWMDG